MIGAPFYLMEKVDGTVIRDRVPAWLDAPAERRRIGEELIDAAAELHAVDYRAVGLDGWGKPTGYVERQLVRWRKQLDGATKFTRPLPDYERIAAWLEEHQPPEQSPAIVQGDYKLDNTMYATDRAGAAGGDPGLGDGDDRRPARRHRLDAFVLAGALAIHPTRCTARSTTCSASRAGRRAPSSWTGTSRGPAGR